MNMYAIVYNEYVKDLVIAHDAEEAKDTMIEFNDAVCNEIEPEVYDTLPIVLVDDTMQFMTGKGLFTVRQVIDAHREPKYWLAIDNKAMQFSS
jgi:hypothetical protein